jgi:hypothetical protein
MGETHLLTAILQRGQFLRRHGTQKSAAGRRRPRKNHDGLKSDCLRDPESEQSAVTGAG